MSTTKPRSPARLRRDLQDIVEDLPRVLAQNLTAEERREYERAGRRARLRLFWLRPGGAQVRSFVEKYLQEAPPPARRTLRPGGR